MDSTSEETGVECPQFDIEQVQIKDEPLDVVFEVEHVTGEAYIEADLEVEKDVDPFHFLRLQYTTEEINRMNEFGASLTYTGKRKGQTCEICFKEYVDLKSMRRHLLRIHNIEPPQGLVVYECVECFEKFSDKSHLERHTLKHTGLKPHVCLKCNKAFSRKEHLTRHLAKVKCDEVKVKKEPTPKKVEKSNSLKKVGHIVAGNEEFPSRKDVEDGPELLTILKVESVRTPFAECTICSKKFVHQTHLRVHMKTHNIPPTTFECPICGKNLSRKDHLNHHIKNLHVKKDVDNTENSVPGNYSCNLCPKTFTESAVYDKHLAMHSNSQLKKEVCDICNHVFLSKWHVRKHMLHKHNIEPENGCLACVYCQKKFIDNYYLKRHYTTKHKNEPFPYDNPFDIVTKDSSQELEKSEPVFLKQEQMGGEFIEEL